MKRALVAALLAVVLAGAAFAQSPHTHQHRFSGAEQWAHVFDDPARDAWQMPHEVIDQRQLSLPFIAETAEVRDDEVHVRIFLRQQLAD